MRVDRLWGQTDGDFDTYDPKGTILSHPVSLKLKFFYNSDLAWFCEDWR